MIFQLDGAKINYEGQGTVYLEEPPGKITSVVVAVHGSGRGALDYRDHKFYRKQRDLALQNGCVFAVVSNRRDTWGTDDGLYNINLLVDFLMEKYAVEKVILWATSAGGSLASRMVKDFPQKVSHIIGTFPVYDLSAEFHSDACRRAWGTENLNEFLAKIQGKNPADFPEALKAHRYYITHGSADTAVPLTENSLKLKADLGDKVTLEIIEGGIHSTKDFSFYGKAVQKAFSELK